MFYNLQILSLFVFFSECLTWKVSRDGNKETNANIYLSFSRLFA